MSSYAEIAHAFAAALVGGEFDAALAMLSPECRAENSAAGLQRNLGEMVEYCGLDAAGADVAVETTLEDWVHKRDDDAGWAYVSISKSTENDGFSEAVAVVVDKNGQIRSIEWGRP